MEVAEAARAAVEATPVPGELRVTISAGVAESTPGGEPLLVAADAALYRAKREGRNRVAAA
jgi:PleD family two-component response regulator